MNIKSKNIKKCDYARYNWPSKEGPGEEVFHRAASHLKDNHKEIQLYLNKLCVFASMHSHKHLIYLFPGKRTYYIDIIDMYIQHNTTIKMKDGF